MKCTPERGTSFQVLYGEASPQRRAFQTSVVSVADDCRWLKRLKNKQTKTFFRVLFRLDEERDEQVESKPEEILQPEEDGSDFPDNELGAVVEFDEDELDEAQTEAEVKNITNKHHITIEELKREVLGSVRKKRIFFFFEVHLLLDRVSFAIGPEYNNQNSSQEQLACKGLRSGLQVFSEC